MYARAVSLLDLNAVHRMRLPAEDDSSAPTQEPVNRDGNQFDELKLPREKKVVGILPQGGIRGPNSEMEGRPGVVRLAIKTSTPHPIEIDACRVGRISSKLTPTADFREPDRSTSTASRPLHRPAPHRRNRDTHPRYHALSKALSPPGFETFALDSPTEPLRLDDFFSPRLHVSSRVPRINDDGGIVHNELPIDAVMIRNDQGKVARAQSILC